MTLDFYNFMLRYKGRSNAFGDLIGDMIDDINFPHIKNYEHLQDYLQMKGADTKCLDTAYKAWEKYVEQTE